MAGNTTKEANTYIQTVSKARITMMGRAKEASCHSFSVIKAMPRKTFRQVLPITSMAFRGSSRPVASATLRKIRATSREPM